MPLLDRDGLKADPWDRADPAAAAAILPFDALEAELQAAPTNRRLGVDLPNHVHPHRLLPFQDRLALIAIGFPSFKDGRGFSLARMLRAQGYQGTLRASGWIIPDQFAFALQCGFDEIEISDEQAQRQPVGQWLPAPARFSDGYQDTHDGRVSIFKQRQRAAAEAS